MHEVLGDSLDEQRMCAYPVIEQALLNLAVIFKLTTGFPSLNTLQLIREGGWSIEYQLDR